MNRTEDLNTKIGTWLKEKRTEKNLSQQAVADRMGCTRTAIHYWESGKRTIYAVNLLDYCKAIGVNADELVRELLG